MQAVVCGRRDRRVAGKVTARVCIYSGLEQRLHACHLVSFQRSEKRRDAIFISNPSVCFVLKQ